MTLLVSPSSDVLSPAMPWETTAWFNGDPLDLAQLRGRVVVLEAFQMLCPSCVSHALPQAVRLSRTFGDEVAVVGLHTVFEHHEAMTPVSLKAFLHEYRITFPVGVDAVGGEHPAPVTFSRYRMRGTPTTVLVDRDGMLRAQKLGPVDDMTLASAVTTLLDGVVPPSACTIDGTCT
ncbi:TlpA disulfide reductase family protein [Umezawaea beigongshangensis]|uniref:TlpA disulfide reductase family protein n=1 Tax=Umezawaea beigongshangensis TaxID=2780383 RepID=UPI0018F1534A|nr:TlpA disulfide reductase family protein [Umezawaea beigongshangensis]